MSDELMNGRELPEGWSLERLDVLAYVRYGKAKPITPRSIPGVGSSSIYGTAGDSLVDYPTLVIGRKGTAGAVWFMKEPCWPSDTTVEVLHACDAKIAALEREAAAHDELFKALLEELMTGRRRVGALVEQ
jgi:hypothetical protein